MQLSARCWVWGCLPLSASASPGVVLLQIAGAVCVLLWGSFSVRDGVREGFSARLTALLSSASRASPVAVLYGAIVAILTQSATATILITVSLVDAGVLGLAAATAVVLGADLGSAIATRVLYLNLSLVPPVLMVVGFCFYMLSGRWRLQCLGRILIGLGLMLLGLGWVREAIEPLVNSPISSAWRDVLASVPWISAVVVAGLTWVGHSSVAAVLVIATIDQSGVLPPPVTLAMLLGANIGAGLIALPMVARASPSARSLVFANLSFRFVVAFGLLLGLGWLLSTSFSQQYFLDQQAGLRMILAHIGFNLLVVAVWLPFAGLVSGRFRARIDQRQRQREDALTRSVGADLNMETVAESDQALVAARREALRLGDATEVLFAKSLELFDARDHAEVHRVVALDAEINARNKVIHNYLSAARSHLSGPDQEQDLDRILQFSASMEDIGDAVSYDFARLALKSLDRGVSLSATGREEIQEIHQRVRDLLREQINGFADKRVAPTDRADSLLASIQQLCQESIANHRRRLSSSLAESMASSSIHQDLVRDLLQIAMLFWRSPGH